MCQTDARNSDLELENTEFLQKLDSYLLTNKCSITFLQCDGSQTLAGPKLRGRNVYRSLHLNLPPSMPPWCLPLATWTFGFGDAACTQRRKSFYFICLQRQLVSREDWLEGEEWDNEKGKINGKIENRNREKMSREGRMKTHGLAVWLRVCQPQY